MTATRGHETRTKRGRARTKAAQTRTLSRNLTPPETVDTPPERFRLVLQRYDIGASTYAPIPGQSLLFQLSDSDQAIAIFTRLEAHLRLAEFTMLRCGHRPVENCDCETST